MFEIVQLGLLVSAGVSVIAGAIIAAWRLIPVKELGNVPQQRLSDLEEVVEALRLAQIDFADKWETTVRRNNTRVGRLRRKLAKERGDDEDDDEDDEVPAEAVLPFQPPAAPAASGKAALWDAYNRQKGQP